MSPENARQKCRRFLCPMSHDCRDLDGYDWPEGGLVGWECKTDDDVSKTVWVAQGSTEMREVLATSVRRMGWMRQLPASRKLGRDLQRVRAASDLLAP